MLVLAVMLDVSCMPLTEELKGYIVSAADHLL